MVLWLAIIFLGRAIAYDDWVWGSWSPAVLQRGEVDVNAPQFVQDHRGNRAWASGCAATCWPCRIVEATHVLCITLVFGSILVVDLRLLGAVRPCIAR